jgi:long-chain acyl-CoA synthetase
MMGYWNHPDESAEALRGGWFHSGDVGYMDEDDYVYIVDRTKDMINTAGFKVWPREVEEVLYEDPAIAECAVVAALDPVKGEVAVAVIVPKRDRTETPEAFDAYCRERLAAYKVPRQFLVFEALPRASLART